MNPPSRKCEFFAKYPPLVATAAQKRPMVPFSSACTSSEHILLTFCATGAPNCGRGCSGSTLGWYNPFARGWYHWRKSMTKRLGNEGGFGLGSGTPIFRVRPFCNTKKNVEREKYYSCFYHYFDYLWTDFNVFLTKITRIDPPSRNCECLSKQPPFMCHNGRKKVKLSSACNLSEQILLTFCATGAPNFIGGCWYLIQAWYNPFARGWKQWIWSPWPWGRAMRALRFRSGMPILPQNQEIQLGRSVPNPLLGFKLSFFQCLVGWLYCGCLVANKNLNKNFKQK